ncbi:hypothetical protein Q7W34_01845 [Streptococcus suis]|nr:hypothetical protein [Streptococcus suis]
MKQFILECIGDICEHTITITFSNGDNLDFFQVYDDCPNTANVIDLVEVGTDFRHLVNLDYVVHVRLNL